jgi:hypothetical protein
MIYRAIGETLDLSYSTRVSIMIKFSERRNIANRHPPSRPRFFGPKMIVLFKEK